MENSLLSGTHEQFMQILRIIGLCVFEKKKKQTSTVGSICASEAKP